MAMVRICDWTCEGVFHRRQHSSASIAARDFALTRYGLVADPAFSINPLFWFDFFSCYQLRRRFVDNLFLIVQYAQSGWQL